MKYRIKSADVLNEADRYERVLNHQIFVMEQENLLWGYREDISWLPGDFLYPHPEGNYSVCGGGDDCDPLVSRRYDDVELRNCTQRRYYYWDRDPDDNYEGNCVRRMVELFDDGDRYPAILKCKSCEVSWVGPEPCFVCGEFSKPIGPKPKSTLGQLAGLGVSPGMVYNDRSPGAIFDFETLSDCFRPMTEAVGEAMGAVRVAATRFSEQLYASIFSVNEMRQLYSGPSLTTIEEDYWRRVNPSWPGLRIQRTVIDEAGPWMNLNPYPVTPYREPLSVFEREMPERLVLPTASESAAEPIVDDPTHPHGGVQWRSQRTALRLPVMTPEQLGPQRATVPIPVLEPPEPLRGFEERSYPTSNHNLRSLM